LESIDPSIDESIVDERVRFQTSNDSPITLTLYCAILILCYCYGLDQYWYGLLLMLVGVVARLILKIRRSRSGVKLGNAAPFHREILVYVFLQCLSFILDQFNLIGNAEAMGGIARKFCHYIQKQK
jgi:hypothetical protein